MLQPVNDELLFETAWAIAGLEFRRWESVGFRAITLFAVLSQELGSQLVERLFERFAIAQRLLQLGDHVGRDVHTTAAALVGERKDESWVFIPASAGSAAGAEARFTDLGEGAFDGRPEFFELIQESLAEGGI